MPNLHIATLYYAALHFLCKQALHGQVAEKGSGFDVHWAVGERPNYDSHFIDVINRDGNELWEYTISHHRQGTSDYLVKKYDFTIDSRGKLVEFGFLKGMDDSGPEEKSKYLQTGDKISWASKITASNIIRAAKNQLAQQQGNISPAFSD